MKTFKHKFLDIIPDYLEDGVLYVSVLYKTVVHKCACGCGNEVVTPLTPSDWQLTFDGRTISLYPSIGNWGFDCRSHYWISKGLVITIEEPAPLVRRKKKYKRKKGVKKSKMTSIASQAGAANDT